MKKIKIKSIYLDYAATTPLDPLILEEMLPFMGNREGFGNPSSVTHSFGSEASQAIERATNKFDRVMFQEKNQNVPVNLYLFNKDVISWFSPLIYFTLFDFT